MDCDPAVRTVSTVTQFPRPNVTEFPTLSHRGLEVSTLAVRSCGAVGFTGGRSAGIPLRESRSGAVTTEII